LGLIASTRQLDSFVINMSKHFISFQLTMRECAYSFNESIDGFFVASCVACAGVADAIHSPANSTKHRLRAIRLSGSPTSMERTEPRKYIATLSVLLGVAHSLWMMPVDNLFTMTSHQFEHHQRF
jgi:hypothetical protein